MRVADYIAEYLENLGVKKVFLLSGGGMMHLLDAVSRREKLKYVCNHHEQASGIAADAFARVSAGLGVCYATSGPGGTNTLTAVVGAFQDSSPVLFISGQSKTSQTIEQSGLHGLRQFGVFEVDVIPCVKAVTKYAAFVARPEDIRYHLEKAVYLATNGRHGSVFLDIPLDVQGAPIDPVQLRGFSPSEIKQNRLELTDVQIADLMSRLKMAKRPLILAGYGIRASNQVDRFRKMIESLKIPVVTTCFATDVLEFDHPLFVGHPGVKGDRAGNFAVQTADFILALGSSLHISTTGYEMDQFAPNADKVLVDPDEMVLAREQVGVREKFHCDVGAFIAAMTAAAEPLPEHEEWKTLRERWKRELSVYREPHVRHPGKINLYDAVEALDELCNATDIVVTDAGSTYYVIGQAFRIKRGQRVINSGSLGAMGFALPAATGAAMASPSSRVVCITGDGSLQTNVHELAVYKKHDLNIKLFVINNGGYVCIRNTQTNFFKGHLAGTSSDSGVFIPATEKIAAAYEIKYISIDKAADLKATMAEVLAMPGPVICEIFTPPFQEIIPTVSSIRLEDGSMRSKPLHDMSPFMTEEVRRHYLPKGSS